MTQRQEIIERLNGLELEGGSHEMLSAICKAVLPHGDAWTMRRCWDLRDRLVRLLGEADTPHGGGRIDAEHEEALREAYTKGREDGMGMANAKDAHAEYLRGKNDGYDEGWDAGFASADDWCAQHEEAMAEHGWVRLPKDADGEPIHIGDMLEHTNGIFTVNDMTISIDGIWRAWDGENGHTVLLAKCRHHYAPTVEDVLRDCIANVCRANAQLYEQGCHPLTMEDVGYEVDEYITEYAAKLRLAGDAE